MACSAADVTSHRRRLCSRSSRQSKSPSPTATNDPSRARKPAEPRACALPAKIGSLSCLPSLHLLKVRSLRQTRSGSLRAHLQNFVDAYNFARRLKTLRGQTPYEFICKAWTSEPHRFKISPLQQMPGLNI